MAMNRIDRLEREIEKTRTRITEYQNKLKELEGKRTEYENFEIVSIVRSMCMTREKLIAFLHGGAANVPPVKTAYHEQEDIDDEMDD